jgi:hypothetical protein
MAAAIIAASVTATTVTAAVVATPVPTVVAAAFVVAPVPAVVAVLAAPTITPLVAHPEAVILVEFETQRRAEAISARPEGTRPAPSVATPVAVNPKQVAPVVIAIVDRPPVPFAAVVHRAIRDRIIPELVGAA